LSIFDAIDWDGLRERRGRKIGKWGLE